VGEDIVGDEVAEAGGTGAQPLANISTAVQTRQPLTRALPRSTLVYPQTPETRSHLDP
jgi:hypothetical protein